MYSPICLTQVLVLVVFLSFLSGPRRLCCVFLLLCCRPQRLCLTLVSLVKWRGVAVGCAGGVGPGLRRAPSPAPRRGEPALGRRGCRGGQGGDPRPWAPVRAPGAGGSGGTPTLWSACVERLRLGSGLGSWAKYWEPGWAPLDSAAAHIELVTPPVRSGGPGDPFLCLFGDLKYWSAVTCTWGFQRPHFRGDFLSWQEFSWL